jgi:uncharacterized repeat protein (TIGR01451 family)
VASSLGLTLAADKTSAIPGDTLTYAATVTNTGATLTLSGDLTAGNTNATSATIASYWDVVSTNNKAHCGAGGSNDGKNVGGKTWFFEITTAGSVAAHNNKGGDYLIAEFILYVLIL